MIRIHKVLWLLSIGLLLGNHLQAQKLRPFWGLGVFVGASNYAGDLSSSEIKGFPNDQLASLPFTKGAVGGWISYQWHPHMSARLGYTFGQIGADDRESDVETAKTRGLNFRNNLYEVSAVLQYDFFSTGRSMLKRPAWSPYVFGGIAVVFHQPTADINFPNFGSAGTVDLRSYRTEDQTEPYAKQVVSVPFGIGFRAKVAPRIDLRFEVGLRKTFTDYLDDVSGATPGRGGRYADPTVLGSTLPFVVSLRTALAYGTDDPFLIQDKVDRNLRRGNPLSDDWYSFSGVSLVYLLQNAEACPKPRRGRR